MDSKLQLLSSKTNTKPFSQTAEKSQVTDKILNTSSDRHKNYVNNNKLILILFNALFLLCMSYFALQSKIKLSSFNPLFPATSIHTNHITLTSIRLSHFFPVLQFHAPTSTPKNIRKPYSFLIYSWVNNYSRVQR